MKNEERKIAGYYIKDLPQYIIRYSSYLFIYPFKFLPESRLKKAVRKFVLNFYNSVPLFLAINKGDTAIQVGTPNTRTLNRFASLVGPKGKVYIIEANGENVEKLTSFKDSNNLDNVYILPSAAWSERKELIFYLSDIRKGDHKIPIEGVLVDNDYTNEYSSVKIQADTVDNLLKQAGVSTFNYISITVNGAELEVLKGAKQLISESKNCRIYSKGHSLVNGKPLNLLIKEYLQGFANYEVIISKGEPSNSQQTNWKRRAGDVFAWKI